MEFEIKHSLGAVCVTEIAPNSFAKGPLSQLLTVEAVQAQRQLGAEYNFDLFLAGAQLDVV